MDIITLYPEPNLSKRYHRQYVRPYLLRNIQTDPEGYGEKLTKCQTAAAAKLRRLRVVLLLLKDAVQAFAMPHNFKTRPAGSEFNARGRAISRGQFGSPVLIEKAELCDGFHVLVSSSGKEHQWGQTYTIDKKANLSAA